MKKIILSFLLFFLSFYIFAFKNDFVAFRKDAPIEQNAFMCFASNTNSGFEGYTFSLQSKYSFENRWVSFSLGSLLAADDFSFTTDATFWFLRLNHFRMGLYNLYHFENIRNVSNTNDFLLGFDLDVKPCKWFEFLAQVSYQNKITEIIPFRKYGGLMLKNHTGEISVKTIFYPWNFLEVSLELSSTEYFRYTLFFAPSWTFSVTYDWQCNLYTSVELVSRWVDMFTLSGYHEGSEFRLVMGYRW